MKHVLPLRSSGVNYLKNQFRPVSILILNVFGALLFLIDLN